MPNINYTQICQRDKTDSEAEEKQDEDETEKEEPEEEKLTYPYQVFYIISTEACERFSFYGMRTILTLYVIALFRKHMTEDESKDRATIVFHSFTFLCYLCPLLGAALADSFFGKFRTIFYISILYAFGQCVLSFGAFGSGSEWISFLGLILIAVGTGGIKPCVVSLGGDQFKLPEQNQEMISFFAMFYASINFGSLFSTFITPYLREVECMGQDSCYPLAFGVPAALMILAIILFFCGRNKYIVKIPTTNIVVESAKCVKHAITSREPRDESSHWLDAASDRYSSEFLNDLKAVFSVAYLFMPYPMFWALYDQQGSRWTIQATKLSGKAGGWTILPDQMQIVNPILILLLIPLFNQVIYPLFDKVGLLTTPLQRIVTGGLMVAVAFLISALLEHWIESFGDKSVHILWQLPQYFVISVAEVLFSITSLEFAYSQAPTSMKSVVQALYLLTTAFGNLIDIVVVSILSGAGMSQVQEFLLFGLLMVVCMAVLGWMTKSYKYVESQNQEEQCIQLQEEESM